MHDADPLWRNPDPLRALMDCAELARRLARPTRVVLDDTLDPGRMYIHDDPDPRQPLDQPTGRVVRMGSAIAARLWAESPTLATRWNIPRPDNPVTQETNGV